MDVSLRVKVREILLQLPMKIDCFGNFFQFGHFLRAAPQGAPFTVYIDCFRIYRGIAHRLLLRSVRQKVARNVSDKPSKTDNE